MKHIIYSVIKFITLCITGILMVPAAILIAIINLIWKASDGLMDKAA